MNNILSNINANIKKIERRKWAFEAKNLCGINPPTIKPAVELEQSKQIKEAA